jgi:hypothetical protein
MHHSNDTFAQVMEISPNIQRHSRGLVQSKNAKSRRVTGARRFHDGVASASFKILAMIKSEKCRRRK